MLLLHGFPTSSHMFRNLIPALADRYHVIAPDYPGYGQSDTPDRAQFQYTFDRFGELVDGLLDQLGIKRYAMYVMDYGAPVGWRLALKHPDRVSALIVQNGNAYEEGLKEFWDPIKAYWSDHSEEHRKALYVLVKPETTKFQYTDGVSDVTRVAPDNWVHDQALLDRPGNAKKINQTIQTILLQNLEEHRAPICSKPSRGERPLLPDHLPSDLDSPAYLLGAEAALDERIRHADFHQVAETKVNLIVSKIDLGLP